MKKGAAVLSKSEALAAKQAQEWVDFANEHLGAVIAHVIANTEKWAEDNGYAKEKDEKPPLSDQAQRVFDLLQTDAFGCYSKHVAELCSVLLKEEIPYLKEDGGDMQGVEYVPGIAVVPTVCDNGHNYELGKPALVYETRSRHDAHCYAAANMYGGNWITYLKTNVRPATHDEITGLLGLLMSDKTPAALKYLLTLAD